MAIPSGSGTEVLKSVGLATVTNTDAYAITGVQHHIYTVLSISVYCNTASKQMMGYLYMYDSFGSAANQYINLFKTPSMGSSETFVYNDKFAFHGFGSNGATQKLGFAGDASADFDILVTYIDQDWTTP